MISIVSATRYTEKYFWNRSALGRSLKRIANDNSLVPIISFENRRGLPELYNRAIDFEACGDALVFIHDDVWIDDNNFSRNILEGLECYDVIGVAGNRRRTSGQPAWAFKDNRFTWDERCYLSGSVAHGKSPFGTVSEFGPVPAECELLDGVLLAAKNVTLVEKNIRFDPQFDFHFYDMDFCRSARSAGLRIGTWPILLTHQSEGAFGSSGWQEKYAKYLAKWGD